MLSRCRGLPPRSCVQEGARWQAGPVGDSVSVGGQGQRAGARKARGIGMGVTLCNSSQACASQPANKRARRRWGSRLQLTQGCTMCDRTVKTGLPQSAPHPPSQHTTTHTPAHTSHVDLILSAVSSLPQAHVYAHGSARLQPGASTRRRTSGRCWRRWCGRSRSRTWS